MKEKRSLDIAVVVVVGSPFSGFVTNVKRKRVSE